MASSFRLLGVEMAFGMGENGFPPIYLTDDNGRAVILRGRIDRVDFYENEEGRYIRIIDYKSGVPALKEEDMRRGLQLQLFLYLSAVCSALEGKPAGAFYFHVSDLFQDADGIGPLPEEELRALIEKKLADQLKLRGLALRDVEIVEAMGTETLQGVTIRKDGEFSVRSPVREEEELRALLEEAQKVAVRLTQEMESGYMPVSPQKSQDGSVPCRYCDYRTICAVDLTGTVRS